MEILSYEDALTRVHNVRGYPAAADTDDASELIVVEILGVEVSVRRRRTDIGVETYVHIDTENLADEHRPLVIEVDNGGENTYGDDGGLPYTDESELPTAVEVVEYAATWGNTVDEVAAWLRDHNVTDSPDIRDLDIIHNCVVAMGLRAHFAALDATAKSGRWTVGGDGSIQIDTDDAELPVPVKQLVDVADHYRGIRTADVPYPFLYEAMTACDECGSWIPDSETSEVNDFHAESCSLNPANTS